MKPFVILLLSLIVFSCFAQDSEKELKSVKEFQDLKFGMFVHWGPVSLKGTEIGWSRGREVPVEEYDKLYKEFNPINFNADEWIKTLKEAGMKYFVITTRHHDGFSLWPTEYSDYDIEATPYKRDILKALKDACDKYGIVFGTYYSICDWRHPLYPLGSPGGSTNKETGNMEKFIPYVKGQTKELIEKYNTKILWFDGEWEEPWTHEMGLDLYSYLKGLNKNVLINNRVDKGRKGMEGITISDEFAGDFATPEQRVGTYDIENPWESCITICQQWAWKPDDKMKSLEECLFTLLKTVGGGGNLLLNVGPTPDGQIESRQKKRLKEIGEWLKKYSESVYETRGGPYKPGEWLTSTRKGNNIYIHLLKYNKNEVALPFPFPAEIKSCKFLNGKKLRFTKTGGNLKIQLPAKKSNEPVRVIKITLNKDSQNLKTVEIS
ncbi:alpha-L-fucosidase [Maribellus comscasis]|uniref:alpha-L-fucosidase n=1 Tax=Maribellus comscasis TaxID=2681766 RepID=A0A6I6K1F2_9BACT|nr:alpha-L-fucosidase [Maribellus comscasis]QGY46242.1 alpha-L-fucosidase [Maribellus comscasis]